MLVNEFISVFVYVSLAFLCKCYDSSSSHDFRVTSRDIYRWLFEASLFPAIGCSFLCGYIFGDYSMVFDESKDFHDEFIFQKVTLFFVMRCLEKYTPFVVKDMEEPAFYTLCRSFRK